MSTNTDYLKIYKKRIQDWSGGQVDALRGTLLKDNQSQVLKDASLDQRGTLYPCFGHTARVYGLNKIDGVGYYQATLTGKSYLLVAIGAQLYYDDLGGAPALVALGTGWSASEHWEFTVLNEKLYITNGLDEMGQWDGITFTRASSGYRFSQLVTHNNMLWGVEQGTSRLRWSAILNGMTWDINHFIDFNPSGDDVIYRVSEYQSYMVILKRKHKAMLTGDRTANYAYSWVDTKGIVGYKAGDVVEKYFGYVSEDGVHLSDLVNDVRISEGRDHDWNKRVNKAYLYRAALAHWRNYVFVSLPVDGSAHNNEVWCYDLRYNSWVTLTHLNIASWVRVIVNNEELLYGADSVTGQVTQVYVYDKTTYADGTPVQYEWLSKEFTLDEPERYKLFKNIYLEMEGITAQSTLAMTIYVDDVAYPVDASAIVVPAGVGLYRHVRLIPPIYGVVLGRKISFKIVGSVGLRSIVIEYSVRSDIPPGGVI